MGNPIWITPPGDLGKISTQEFFTVLLQAYDPETGYGAFDVKFFLVGGRLPPGLRIDQSGSLLGRAAKEYTLDGVPALVNKDVTSYFSIRAQSSKGEVTDRGFYITVTGNNPPQILSTTVDLGRYFDGTEINIQLEAIDLNLDTLTWKVIKGALPPGTRLDSNTGLISGPIVPKISLQGGATVGYDEQSWEQLQWDYDTLSVNTAYQFTISVSDGKTETTQPYTITVVSHNDLRADNINLTADGGDLFTADLTEKRNPILLTKDLGQFATFRANNYFSYKFDAVNYDGEPIQYQLLAGAGIGWDSDTVYFDAFNSNFDQGDFALPPGLSIDENTGWLTGYIPSQVASSKSYTFGIQAYNTNDPTITSKLLFYTLTIIGSLDLSVTWNQPTRLGTIGLGDSSTFYVSATPVGGQQLSYTLSEGTAVGSKLPPGLTLLQDGTIAGKVSFQTWTMDGGTTTIDGDNYAKGILITKTTIDKDYTFTVQATDITNTISSSNTFIITVDAPYYEPYVNLYIKCLPSLDKRNDIISILQNTDIFPDNVIYRPNDPYYGVSQDLIMLAVNGLKVQDYQAYIGGGNVTSTTTTTNFVSNFTGDHSTWNLSNSGTATLVSTGLPYHSYGNSRVVTQDYSIQLPWRGGSTLQASIHTDVPVGSAAGYWLNGVALFSPSAGAVQLANLALPQGYHFNSAASEQLALGLASYSFGDDAAGGRADADGAYHYSDYSFANAWTTGVGTNPGAGTPEITAIPYLNSGLTHADGHSKILGIAADGYPIYGPFGYGSPNESTSGVRRMISGYSLKPANSRSPDAPLDTYPLGIFMEDWQFVAGGDLDRYNGRTCVTPDYPTGTYAYFCTIGTDGKPVFPYVLGTQYYGQAATAAIPIVNGSGVLPATYSVTAVSKTATSVISSSAGMRDRHFNKPFYFGDYKWAVANDAAGNRIYEVIYVDLIEDTKIYGATRADGSRGSVTPGTTHDMTKQVNNWKNPNTLQKSSNMDTAHATITMQDGTLRIKSNGLPWHSYGNPEAKVAVQAQTLDQTIPLRGGTDQRGSGTLRGSGIIGYALNGVPIFSPSGGALAPDGFEIVPGYNYNAAFTEDQFLTSIGFNQNIYTFFQDAAGGFATGAGIYGYRDYSFASAWESGQGDTTGTQGMADASVIPYYNGQLNQGGVGSAHSRIIGFALDGYPIYGPLGYSNPYDPTSAVTFMRSGYRLRSPDYRTPDAPVNPDLPMGVFIEDFYFAGSGDLDANNGRFCITPEYPQGTYAYFATVGTYPGGQLFGPVYPYFVGNAFHGDPALNGISVATGGGGVAPNDYVLKISSDPNYQIVRPNDLTLMQNDVAAAVGQAPNESLPAWMTSIQPDGKILGFTTAAVMAYIKPSEGEKVLYNLKVRAPLDIKTIPFVADRYIIDDNLAQYFNLNTRRFQRHAFTQFDSSDLQNAPAVAVAAADFGVDLPFDNIDGQTTQFVNSIGGLDGLELSTFDGFTLIFTTQEVFPGYVEKHPEFDGWYQDGFAVPGYDQKVAGSSPINKRAGIWQVTTVDRKIRLNFVKEILPGDVVKINLGSKANTYQRYDLSVLAQGGGVPAYRPVTTSTINIQSETLFDDRATIFITNTDNYTAPFANDHYLKFPKTGVFPDA
jgi:YHYH protein/Putative Ig domain